jgi:Zn-dependent peptidase ImmA (M78 family)
MAVGDAFEKRVFDLFARELAEGGLPLRSDACKIFWKKGYFSKDRESEIIVDVSIEAYLPNQNHWSMLWVIECKDYSQSVPVNDVEEFFAKLQQIGGANLKGVMISPSAFQKGALKFAQSKGIGLVRLLDQSKLKWILTRPATRFITHEQIQASRANVYSGLTEEGYVSDNIDFYSNIAESYTHSLRQLCELLFADLLALEMFQSIVNEQVRERNSVPYVESEDIEAISADVLHELHHSGYEVPIESYTEILKESKGINVTFVEVLGKDKVGFDIMGSVRFDPLTIHIARGAHATLFSRKFTLAHELGHIFMNHQQVIEQECYSDEDFERNTAEAVTVAEIRRVEWQANHFASCLLLPKKPLLACFHEFLSAEDIRDRGHGVLFVDKQECNLNSFYKVTNQLIDTFRVSRKVIELRLTKLNCLTDRR